MSFFDLGKREYKNTEDRVALGPGKYLSISPREGRQGPSYAPFGSVAPRRSKQPQNKSIGPGDYNISSPIIKPSIIRYENKNMVIVKINDQGAYHFKSRSNRFQEPQSLSVGPGSYNLDDGSSSVENKRSNSSHHQPEIVKKIRQINQQFHQSRQPSLLSQPQLVKDKKERKEMPAVKGVLDWSLNSKERFEMLTKERQNSEIKDVNPSESLQKKYKVKPSAVFASKTMKSHLEAQIYKTNNTFKAEIRKIINFKDEQPGPGSYYTNKPKNRTILPEHQFFGSAAERFPEDKEDPVGPGLYQVNPRTQNRRLQENLSFSEERHSYLSKNDIPGPGSYLLDPGLIKNSFSQKQNQLSFGSQKPRFPEQKQPQGQQKQAQTCIFGLSNLQQKQANREKDMQQLKRITQQHPSAVFTSNTKRFQTQPSNNPSIGCYDTTINDINARIARHQKLAKQLEQCQLYKPPFLSSDDRFKSLKVHQSQHRNCWCQVKSVEKQMIDHESPVFISNQPRIVAFDQPAKAPPVGYYNTSQGQLIKDSFNSRFVKRNQNRRRKDAQFKIKVPIHNRIKTEPECSSPSFTNIKI